MISERLKDFIDGKGLSLKDAAARCSIPYRSLQNYCSGKQLPGTDALVKLSDGLDINIDWLLTGDNNSHFPDSTPEKSVCDIGLLELVVDALRNTEYSAFSGVKLDLILPLIAQLYNQAAIVDDLGLRKKILESSILLLSKGVHLEILDTTPSKAMPEELREVHRSVIEKIEEKVSTSDSSSVTQVFEGATVGNVAGRDIYNEQGKNGKK
jgi:transcriptional regulator with XRE-family HTH domain